MYISLRTTSLCSPKGFLNKLVSSNIGVNYKLPQSKSRIGIQCGTPIYRDVNGPQMEPDFKCSLGFSTMM